MAYEEDIVSKTKRLIQDYVDEHWSSTHSACYFSSIGVHLSRVAPETRAALPNGLGEFLRQNPVVRVVQFPGVTQKIAAIPLSVSVPEDVKALFLPSKSIAANSNRNVYLQEFWDAFIRPIEGTVRSIVIDDSNRITVHDSPTINQSGTVYQIEPQDLTPNVPNRSIADKVSATHSVIDAWLQKHSLDSTIFLRARARRQILSADNRLIQLLNAIEDLSEDDLARIRLPLDIVVKLASKK
ncbi:MAG: hypothetical protein OXI87_10365 [Albidovulum sp.]|nr:hypothetical protein [Albidovulum sp.]MDE0530014.1 hypothetical protein [Albidovulum sp.]